MSSNQNAIALPKVQSKKQFMDELYDRIRPPRTPANDAESSAGRPPDLKTYIVENNSKIPQEFYTESLRINIDQTGLDDIKIITLTDQRNTERRIQCYLDKTDERFLILHTFDLAKHVIPMIEHMINSSKVEFDNAWLPTGLLRSISRGFGNSELGYDVQHKDYFQHELNDSDPIKPDTYSTISVSGGQSDKILQLLNDDSDIAQLLSYSKVIVGRGTKSDGVVDDLYYNGRFSVVKGDSVDDHISLVNAVKEKYSEMIHGIEKYSIYGDQDTKFVEGKPFVFRFKRKVDDWDYFLERMFNSKEPFRVWGIRNKIYDEFYQILGVDAHTDHPFDIEVTNDLFRVYLPKGSCGNLVARLFVNLQRFFDSQISCSRIEAVG